MRPPAFPFPGAIYEKSYFDNLVRILNNYFSTWSAEVEYSANRSGASEHQNDAQMGDDQRTFVSAASGVVFTLPPSSRDREGRSWTVVAKTGCPAYVILSASDYFTFTTATSVYVPAGASLTFRCVADFQWSIV